jgi:hypothetical protein
MVRAFGRSHDHETGAFDQRGRSPHEPSVMYDVRPPRLDTSLQRIDVGKCDRGRCKVSVEHSQPASRLQHAVGLGERPLRLWYVRGNRVANDHIEATIGEGKLPRVSLLKRQPLNAVTQLLGTHQ